MDDANEGEKKKSEDRMTKRENTEYYTWKQQVPLRAAALASGAEGSFVTVSGTLNYLRLVLFSVLDLIKTSMFS